MSSALCMMPSLPPLTTPLRLICKNIINNIIFTSHIAEWIYMQEYKIYEEWTKQVIDRRGKVGTKRGIISQYFKIESVLYNNITAFDYFCSSIWSLLLIGFSLAVEFSITYIIYHYPSFSLQINIHSSSNIYYMQTKLYSLKNKNT